MADTRPYNFSVFEGFAHTLADASGAAILPLFRSRLAVDDKGFQEFDPVTAADRTAEQRLQELIALHHPEHGVHGEEFGVTPPQGGEGYRWILDPIDGTRAFIMGLPTWGTLIALAQGPVAGLGIMDQPYTQERYWGVYHAGAFFRRGVGAAEPIHTRSCADLRAAVFSCTHPDLFGGSTRAAHDRLKAVARMTRYGGDCYGYCRLAAGDIDVIVEPGLKSYDVAALIPIIEGAGGRITTWDGGNPIDGGDIVATGDPRLHDQVLSLLQG